MLSFIRLRVPRGHWRTMMNGWLLYFVQLIVFGSIAFLLTYEAVTRIRELTHHLTSVSLLWRTAIVATISFGAGAYLSHAVAGIAEIKPPAAIETCPAAPTTH